MNRLLAFIASLGWWLIPLAVVAAAIGWETDWGRSLRVSPPEAVPVTPKPVAAAVLPDYAVAGGVAARPDTVARTLFNPTRRPAPTLVAEAPKPTIKRGQFTLTGTLVVDGKSTAFLRETAGGKSRRVLQGESINGLLVAEVKPDRIKLTMGDEFEDVVLKVAISPKPPVVAAVAPTPAAAAAAAAPPRAAGAPGPTVVEAPTGTITDRRREMQERLAAQRAQAAANAAAPTGAPSPPPAESFDPRWAPQSGDSAPRREVPNRRTK